MMIIQHYLEIPENEVILDILFARSDVKPDITFNSKLADPLANVFLQNHEP